jgi:hypothetical protein
MTRFLPCFPLEVEANLEAKDQGIVNIASAARIDDV